MAADFEHEWRRYETAKQVAETMRDAWGRLPSKAAGTLLKAGDRPHIFLQDEIGDASACAVLRIAPISQSVDSDL
jgi:hypothetical protein